MWNPVDALVEAVAPAAGVRRAYARKVLATYRAYDAAAKTRRTAGWRATGNSSSAETEFSLTTLRNRHRELVRNNPHAKAAVGIWERNAIGQGFKLRVIGGTRASKKAKELYEEWAGTTAIDPSGKLNFAGQSAQGMRSVVEGGEFLIRRRWRRSNSGLPVPLQLQLLEPDHLDTTKTRIGKGREKAQIWQGVQYSNRGRLEGYWLYPDHPGDARSLRRQSVFVPAKDVIHCFRPERIGQVRGIPWGAACMLRLRKLGDYEDAELERKVVASMFVGFVHDIEGGLGDSVIKAPGAELELEPGTWEELPTGKTIDFSDPPKVEGYKEFVEVSLHAIAKTYEVTYEDLTGDLSMVNFSSARLGRMAHADAVISFQRNTWTPQVLDRVWMWFLEAAQVMGLVTSPVKAMWTPPVPRLADPKTEITTASLRVRNGFQSLSGATRDLGRDPQEVQEEMAEDWARTDQLGLILDCDGRQTTSSGADREENQGNPDDPDGGIGVNPNARSSGVDPVLLNGSAS